MSWRARHLPLIEFSHDELEQLAFGHMGFDDPSVLDKLLHITLRDLASLSREPYFRFMSSDRVAVHWTKINHHYWAPVTGTMEDALRAIVSWAIEALEEHWDTIGRFEAALQD